MVASKISHRPLSAMAFALTLGQGIDLLFDRATDTFALSDRAREEADRTTADGELVCLVEARALHAAGDLMSLGRAHRLQRLIHLRAAELGSYAMAYAAQNVCRESHGLPIVSHVASAS